MNCTIHKNRFGRVTSVKAQNGEDSILFKKLAGLPFIRTQEEAATILATSIIHSPIINKSPSHLYETGEPKIYFKISEGVTESYKDAILNNTDKVSYYGYMSVSGQLISFGSF